MSESAFLMGAFDLLHKVHDRGRHIIMGHKYLSSHGSKICCLNASVVMGEQNNVAAVAGESNRGST